MQLVVVSAVSSAVSTVITMSTILLTVLFVPSFIVLALLVCDSLSISHSRRKKSLKAA